MKIRFDNFVHSYKDILMYKNRFKLEKNKSETIKNLVFSAVVISLSFIITGYLLNILENLDYVFLATNTVILGSFLLLRISKEIKFQNRFKIRYSITTAVANDSLQLVAVILLSNTIFFILYMRLVILIPTLIIMLILSTVVPVIINIIEKNMGFYYSTVKHNIFLTSIFVLIMYISLFYILSIESITLSYVVSTLIISILYYYKLSTSRNEYFVNSPLTTTKYLIIFLIVFMSFLNYMIKVSEQQETITNLVVYKPNIQKFITLGEDNIIVEIFSTKEYLFIQTENTIEAYNRNFEHVKTLDILHSKLPYYFISNNQLNVIHSTPENGVTVIGRFAYANRTQYRYDEEWNLIKEGEFINYYNEKTFSFKNYDIAIYKGINDIYVYEPIEEPTENEDNFQSISLHPYDFNARELIVAEKDYAIYKKEGTFHRVTISNGYLSYCGDNVAHMVSLDDYIHDTNNDSIVINDSRCHGLNDQRDYRIPFAFANNQFYIYGSTNEISVYNKSGKFENQVPISNLYYTNVLIDEDLFVSWDYRETTNVVTIYDSINPGKLGVDGTSYIITKPIFILIIGLMLLIDLHIANFSRGHEND